VRFLAHKVSHLKQGQDPPNIHNLTSWEGAILTLSVTEQAITSILKSDTTCFSSVESQLRASVRPETL